MGQRLIITIVENGKALANAYYHWSAYTKAAMILTEDILLAINDYKKTMTNNKLIAIRALEKTGALLQGIDIPVANKIFPNEKFKEATNRNEGIISITKKEIKASKMFSNGDVIININTEEYEFDVYFITDEEDFKENFPDEELKALPRFFVDTDSSDSTNELFSIFKKNNRFINNYDELIYSIIE